MWAVLRMKVITSDFNHNGQTLLLLDPQHSNLSIKYLIDYFDFSSSAESSACQQRRREGGCWSWRAPAWWQSAREQRQHTQFCLRSQPHSGILRTERPLPSLLFVQRWQDGWEYDTAPHLLTPSGDFGIRCWASLPPLLAQPPARCFGWRPTRLQAFSP